jgi:1-deoxy-D-xylulose-5-phosphate synthase
MLELAVNSNNPVVIRYPKNSYAGLKKPVVCDRTWQILRQSEQDKVSILAVGPRALKIAQQVADKLGSIKVVSARTIKPLDKAMLNQIKDTIIVTLEENSVIGGFGSLVNGYYSSLGANTKVINIGIEDKFIAHGDTAEQLEQVGLSMQNVINKIEKVL